MKRIVSVVCAAALAFGLAITPGYALTTQQALDLLEENYLRDIPKAAYDAEDLAALFGSLGDPYTYYMSKEEYESFLNGVESTVSLVGIGVSIQYTNEGILVVEPLKGSSALEAGLKAGDLIVEINGESCVPANENHRDLIVGAEGTYVSLKVLRDGVTRSYRLERRAVTIPNTDTKVVDGHIGFIKCSSFGTDTAQLFREGIAEQNDAVDRWIVDLRSNSGGLANAAVDCVGALNGPGFYLYIGNKNNELRVYVSQEEDQTEHPVIVLTNGYSASASEAFAGDIRDLGLGISVGGRTFGKGIGQSVYDGSNCPDYFTDDAVKITTFRFYSFSGVTNDQVGIIPTLAVDAAHAEGVALALNTKAPTEGEYIRLNLNGCSFYVTPSDTEPEILSALFGALAPDVVMALGADGEEQWTDVKDCARHFDITYKSRWFRDVDTSLFAAEINTLGAYGILDGVGNGRFSPDRTMTRAELSAMVVKALNLHASENNPFTDVSEDGWYAPYVKAAAAAGFFQGHGGRFRPNAKVTREECWTVMARIARYLSLNINYAAGTLEQWELDAMKAKGFVNWSLADMALMNRMDALQTSRALEPHGAITREEAASALYAVLTASKVLTY